MPVAIQESVLLPIVVNPDASITIADQITQQIKLLIVRGHLQANQPLPSIIDLAKYLGINNTTVAVVYKKLTEQKYLVGNRGKRSVVADSSFVRQMVARKHFYDLLSQAWGSASQYGLSISEFSAAAYAQAVMVERHQLNLVFVNFYPDNIDVSSTIKTETGLNLVSIPWAYLQAKEPQSLQQLLSADLIVTTIKNLWDVAQIADPTKEVIGIDVQPDMELVSHISSLPRNSKLLFVCHEQTSSEAMKQIIDHNIHHVESKAVTFQCVQNNVPGLQEFDLIVCSSQVENQLSKYIPTTVKLITFSIGIDPVNLLVLQARLAAVEMEKLM